MPGDDAFQVEGVIAVALANGTYRVELANGHRLLGFVPGKRRLNSRPMVAGDKVRVRLSPFDLSVGRILWEPVGG